MQHTNQKENDTIIALKNNINFGQGNRLLYPTPTTTLKYKLEL